jgi:hypothetical protein
MRSDRSPECIQPLMAVECGGGKDLGMKGTATSRPVPSAVLRGSLRDGLLVCLGLLATDPERFEQAAVVWHRRWCAEQPGIGFAGSRAALSALEALPGSDPEAAAAELRAACPRTEGIQEVLDAWLECRSRDAPG